VPFPPSDREANFAFFSYDFSEGKEGFPLLWTNFLIRSVAPTCKAFDLPSIFDEPFFPLPLSFFSGILVSARDPFSFCRHDVHPLSFGWSVVLNANCGPSFWCLFDLILFFGSGQRLTFPQPRIFDFSSPLASFPELFFEGFRQSLAVFFSLRPRSPTPCPLFFVSLAKPGQVKVVQGFPPRCWLG